MHPAVLDACIQITAYKPFHANFAPNDYYLPSRIGELVLHQPPKAGYFPRHVYAHVQLRQWMPGEFYRIACGIQMVLRFTADSMQYDVAVIDDLGNLLCTMRRFEVDKHQISPHHRISTPLHIVSQPMFRGTGNSKKTVRSDEPDQTQMHNILDSSLRASKAEHA